MTDSTLSKPLNSIKTTSFDLQKAWHILSLIIQFKSPLSLLHIPSLSTLFPLSPDYVAYLCSIADSPILLTDNLLVVPSVIAFRALNEFLSSFGGFVSRFEFREFSCVRSFVKRRKRTEAEFEWPFLKKRFVLRDLDEDEENKHVKVSTSGASSNCSKGLLLRGDSLTKEVGEQATGLRLHSQKVYKMVRRDFSKGQGCKTNNIDLDSSKGPSIFEYAWEDEQSQSSKCQNNFFNAKNSLHIHDLPKLRNTEMFMPYLKHFMQTTPVQKSAKRGDRRMFDTVLEQRTRYNATACMEVEEQSRVSPFEVENVSHACLAKNTEVAEDGTVDNIHLPKFLLKSMESDAKTFMELEEERRVPLLNPDKISHACPFNNTKVVKTETVDNCKTEKNLVVAVRHEGESAGLAFHYGKRVFLRDANQINLCVDVIPPNNEDIITARVDKKDSLSIYKSSFHHNQPLETSGTTKTSKRKAPRQEAQLEVSGNNWENISPSGKTQCIQDKTAISVKQKVKKKRDGSILSKREHDKYKEVREKHTETTQKNQPEIKPLPTFELYTVEEEEGSGGYGTVYRARRKSDGVTFAIKCPHENANNKHHFLNELKMLERFGGKNSVIKFEGSFMSGGSECLVLEHVQHDRPEILKREIEVSQLMWYGYSMFRALAALHKQGIVHRDVKPGNFLFSRKAQRGFLIDFNLATDLHQKYGVSNKPKVVNNVSSNQVPPIHTKTPLLANKKFLVNKSIESTSKKLAKDSKPQFLHNTHKKDAGGSKKTFSGQGADGSGVTSAKDATSTKIPVGEKSKELRYLHNSHRKELVTLAHQSRQSTNYEAQNIPASKRKRVSAPRKLNNDNVCITPMPLFSNGVEVAGSGRIKDEGERKQNRGPCVGTKGFRAPEVLFRSAHQGPKIDIWSAGVTLLYMAIGKIPFTGDPEQNIKEIAQLRGSQDLWEVAKLHNRVSSFPPELHDLQFLSSVELRDWCRQITKRPDFFKEIPKPFFDLVDKCLTVNPRLRLSAEEAFRHEFFSPFRVDLRRKWPQSESNSDFGNSQLLQKETLESIIQ